MHRTLAAFCAALVFVLGLFAASPGLHHQLHHNAGGAANDVCAITLFANGVSAPVVVNVAPPPPPGWECAQVSPAADVFIASPHYRFQPERGPPTV